MIETGAEYARRTGGRRLPVVVAAVRGVRESDRARRVGTAVVSRVARSPRVVARAAYTVGAGQVSWVRRVGDALTHGPVREQVRLARVAGDREALAEWTERLVMLKDRRGERLRALPATLCAGLTALAVVGCVLAGVLLLAGLGVTLAPGGLSWHGWWSLLAKVLDGAGSVLTVAVQVGLWGAVPAVLVAAWREGRRAAAAPRWLLSGEQRAEDDSEISPDLLTAALQHAKISRSALLA